MGAKETKEVRDLKNRITFLEKLIAKEREAREATEKRATEGIAQLSKASDAWLAAMIHKYGVKVKDEETGEVIGVRLQIDKDAIAHQLEAGEKVMVKENPRNKKTYLLGIVKMPGENADAGE